MTISVGSTSTPSSGLLTSMGVGSGLDVAGLVSKLVAARKAPQQDQITNQQNAANTQLSALGQVSAALSALQSAMASLTDGSAFTGHAVGSSDSTVLGASSTGTPVNGSYSIVVTQLAGSLKASSGAFASSTTQVGTGTLTLAVGSQQMSLNIDTTNGSLASIRDAINSASNNPGVSATIVIGTDGAHLVLSGTQTGVANGFKVSSSGGNGGLAALNYNPATPASNGLSVITPAQDANYTIDRLSGSSASNTVSAAIDGLSLNLVKLGSSTVSVSSDVSKATSALTNLVSSYNSFIGIYKNLTAYNATTGSAGALIGDATLNSIDSTLSNIVGGSANGTTLSSIGISLQVDGTLLVNSSTLQTALSDGGKTVGAMFAGSYGFAAQLNKPLASWAGSSGILASRSTDINQQLSALANQQITLNSRMDSLTARYQAQFTALDTLMSKLNSTSSYLTQQFAALNNTNSNGK